MRDPKIELSVVVAAWNGRESLVRCLESLEKQNGMEADEIIVVSNFEADLVKNGSAVSFHLRPDSFTVPELRRDGIEVARGDVVALIEDHCTVDRNWSRQIKRAHASGATVIGGSVENASIENDLDWAVYFYDYGKFMLPNRVGQTESLSGLNVSYKRAALDQIRDVYKNGFFETFSNDALKKRGYQLSMMPSAIVYHRKNYRLRRAASHSFHLARSYAAQRTARSTFARRLAFILGSLLLPVLLPARIVLSVSKKRRNLGRLVRAVPFLILLMSIWSAGEFCGYFAGEGRSREVWR